MKSYKLLNTTKSQVLNKLMEADNPKSDEEIALELDISRNAVWQAVKSLREEGFLIEAKTNLGYELVSTTDSLNRELIQYYLLKGIEEFKGETALEYFNLGFDMEIFPSIDSTNAQAKRELAEVNDSSDLFFKTILTQEQTRGRGRLGREFASPKGDGIYFSLILPPAGKYELTTMYTVIAAVGVVKAMDSILKKECQNVFPQIKWVNDILLKDNKGKNKKICGILTEAVSEIEMGTLSAVVLGIGININVDEKAWKPELQSTAGSIKINKKHINEFLALLILNISFFIHDIVKITKKDGFLNDVNIDGMVNSASDFSIDNELISDMIKLYKERSMIIGERISIIKHGNDDVKLREALAVDIDNMARLVVKYDNGDMETLSSAEVSVKSLNG